MLKYAVAPEGNISDRYVVPDIIIHQRKSDNNLLAIEIKKTTTKENRFKDHAKLEAFRGQLGYKYTLFIDFITITGTEHFGISSWELIENSVSKHRGVF
jgi:hypothetical protein